MVHQQRRTTVDIEFSNLTYKVQGGKKTILHSVSGEFRAGQLSAIIGSSGSGKSSLMDVLIGYKSAGVSGSIRTNGGARVGHDFHKASCYIPQEQLVQPHLSVLEAMHFAASFKMGPACSLKQQHTLVSEILSTLGLTSCRDTTAERLSGGQRKRLSIALELLSNPPVLFLDEPTTGLDVVSVTQCMQLLRTLAVQQGRTIVCTIHQPSASLFALFHHVYVLAQGCCVYQGAAHQVVPFLASIQMPCPPHYNPADHVLEVSHSSGERVAAMSLAVQNGKLSLRGDEEEAPHCRRAPMLLPGATFDPATAASLGGAFPTSSCRQFTVLLHRMLLQTARNKSALGMAILYHVMTMTMISVIYYNTGHVADTAFRSFLLCQYLVFFFKYTYVMSPVLLFPAEVKLLKREYFNRWYGLKPYFLAMSVARLPSMVLLGTMMVTFTYVVTNQPLEPQRFLAFLMVCLLVSATSEGLGLAVGSVCSITNGSIFGPSISFSLFVLSVYGAGFGPYIEPYMQLLMNLDFMRLGMQGLMVSLHGNNRPPLECQQLFCFYRRSSNLLKELGMQDVTVWSQILGLLVYLFIFRGVAFLALRYRLATDFKIRLLNVYFKFFKHKCVNKT